VNFKKLTMAFAVAGTMLVAGNAQATNWLRLQGGEDPGSGGRAKVWGFLQPTYQKDVSKGTGPEPTRIGPNLDGQEQFQLFRARIGVRGTPLPLDDSVNYFIMAEFGHNAATDGGRFGSRTPGRLMDASVTVSKITGARVRFGLFKTPGPEETFQGIPALDYINFTWVGNQLMLERYSNGISSTANGDGVPTPAESSWDTSFGAARDTGIQVFDWFKTGDWVHSYAVMIGNGAGLEPYTAETVDGQHDVYAYWASEWVFGGKGPFQQGWKTFVWSQSGKRQGDFTDDATVNPQVYNRTRYGIGTRYRRGDWRVTAEYMAGKGMIFQGPEKPNMSIGPFLSLDGKADGYYADVGYYIPGTDLEADLRYDVYHRSTENVQIAADFFRTTVGLQWHMNKKSRLILNYEIRSAEAENNTGTPPNTNLRNGLAQIGNRYGIQITTIF
jgi:hypothetical protein